MNTFIFNNYVVSVTKTNGVHDKLKINHYIQGAANIEKLLSTAAEIQLGSKVALEVNKSYVIIKSETGSDIRIFRNLTKDIKAFLAGLKVVATNSLINTSNPINYNIKTKKFKVNKEEFEVTDDYSSIFELLKYLGENTIRVDEPIIEEVPEPELKSVAESETENASETVEETQVDTTTES